jgi:MobA/MobL family protein
MLHLDVRRIVKGVGGGGAVGFGRYLARERVARKQQPSDLRALGYAHLPPWAEEDPQHYFAMAQRYERKNGIIARLYEMSLPRALSLEAQQDLVHDIQETLFTRHPVAWALHVPVASDGQTQPHVHFMVSERVVDGVERGVKRFFRRAAVQGRDPAEGGARKELSWTDNRRIMDVRLAVAVLTNAALERAGVAQAVSPWSLRAQGFDRAVLQYANAGQRAVVEAER